MTDAHTAVTALHRRITAVLFARQLVGSLAVAFVLWGIAMLLTRRAGVTIPEWIAMIAIAVAIAAALLRTRGRIPRRAAVVALIDHHARAGGLLMAREVMPVGAWQTEVAAVPRVVWASRRMTIVTTLCAAFAAGAAWMPMRERTAQPKLVIDADAGRLQARVELLREENILPAERAEAITTTLEKLRDEAAGDDPAKAWETLDTIDESTARAARDAADAAVEKAEQLTRTEAMAFALENADVGHDVLEAGKKDFAAELDVSATQLTPEQLKQIAESAKQGKEALRQTLKKLHDAGLIDAKTLRAFERGADAGDRAELAKFLKENASGTRLLNGVTEWVRRGEPGVSRGRADAPLFFGEESARGAAFKEQTLPAATAASLAKSQLVALSAAAPAAGEAQRSTGGALTNAEAGGGSALTPAVQPRHRGTVRRFFERNDR